MKQNRKAVVTKPKPAPNKRCFFMRLFFLAGTKQNIRNKVQSVSDCGTKAGYRDDRFLQQNSAFVASVQGSSRPGRSNSLLVINHLRESCTQSLRLWTNYRAWTDRVAKPKSRGFDRETTVNGDNTFKRAQSPLALGTA